MARQLRIKYAGAIYHVMKRGDRREAIFADDLDRQCFLRALSEAFQKTQWQVLAYGLMPNHFHAVLETPQPNLVAGMKGAAGMEQRRQEDLRQEFKAVRRGWCLGSEAFRRELQEQVTTGPGPSHYGEAAQEMVEVKAERVVGEALGRLGWTEADLGRRRKGDPAQVRLAGQLRAETTMSLAWIARRLRMGSRGYLTWLPYRQDHRPPNI